MVMTSTPGSIVLSFFLACLSFTAHAGLTVSSDKQQVQLGKYLVLNLTYTAPGQSTAVPEKLEDIDTRLLESQFHVEKFSDVLSVPASNTISWKLRLYPYATGDLTIPALRFLGHGSDPVSIKVTSPVDLKTGLPIRVQHSTSNSKPWIRQQIQFLTRLTSTIDIRQLELETKNIRTLELVQLDTLTTRNKHQNTVTAGWAASANKPGVHTIKLPPVKLIRDGVITHLFYPPPVQLTVKPLPVYVPATIPVGEIFFSNMGRRKFVFQDSLSSLELSLSGSGINEASIPDISNQLHNTNSLRFYPKQTSSDISTLKQAISVSSNYKIPFKVLNQGITSLPAISLTYFDPASGTLKSKTYPAIQFFSINSWLYYFILGLFSLLMLWILLKAFLYFRLALKSYVRINQALQKFRQVRSRDELRQAMRLASQARGYQENITPSQWLNIFHSQQATNPALEQSLNRIFYHIEEATGSLDLLAKQLEQHYRQSIPVIRWF